MSRVAIPSNRSRANLLRVTYAAKVLGAGLAFTLLFYFSDTAALGATLEVADYRWITAGSAIFLGGQFLAAQRWRRVLRVGSVSLSRFEVMRLNLLGTFIGNFLPGQGSGDLVKAAFLFGSFPNRRTFLFASVIYDRLLGLFAMLSIVLLSVFFVGAVHGDWSLANMAGGLLVLFAALVMASRYFHRLQSLGRFLGDRLGKRFTGFSSELIELLRNRPLLFRTGALSIVFQLSWVMSLWMMLRAVEPSTPLAPVLLAAPMAVLIASVPLSLGGLGVREGAFSLLMQHFGIAADVASAGALLSLIPLLLASSFGACLALVGRREIVHPSSY